MKTVAQLTNAIATVEPASIGRAHKIICAIGNFYKVQSSRDETVEYSVRWDARKGFSCTCPSGERAFSNCKIGVCSHVLIALAASAEEKEAVNELHRLIAEQAAPVASSAPTLDVATRARIEAANERQAGKVSRAKAPDSKPFSLLR